MEAEGVFHYPGPCPPSASEDEDGLDAFPRKQGKDLYAVLGVEKDADLETIKRSYKKLALQYHPDKNQGNQEAAAVFKEISLAHNILSDGDKRAYYDETGDTEDVDLSAEDFMAMFRETMVELMAGASIKDMLEGMTEEEVRMMPPFPFPKELFPQGTFPSGLRCSSEGLKGVPPSVSSILNSDKPERLGELFEAAADRIDRDDEEDEDEAKQRRRRNRFFGGNPFGGAFGGGGGGDLGGDFDESDLLRMGLGLEDMLAAASPFSRKAKGSGSQRRKGRRGKASRSERSRPKADFDFEDLEQASDELLFQILGGQMKDIPTDMAGMERLMQSAMGLDVPGEEGGKEEKVTAIAEIPPSDRGTSTSVAAAGASSGSQGAVSNKVGKEWIAAAKTGDSGALSSLLGKHPSLLNFCGPGVGHSALHWLCAKNYKGLVVWIVGQGADVNRRNNEGSTPLHAAASNGNMECVQMLLHYGADPFVRDSYGETASKIAKDRKHMDIHKTLERAPRIGGGPDTSESIGARNEPAAASAGENGALAEDKACQECDSVQAEESSDVPAPTPQQRATDRGVVDEKAAEEGNACSRSEGPSVESQPSSSSDHPAESLHFKGRIGKEEGRRWMNAAKSGDLEALRALLDKDLYYLLYKGSGTNYSFTGNTAVHWCAAKGHEDALRWLLEQGGDPNGANNAGSTPIHSAGVNGQMGTAKILLFEFGGDATVTDGLGDLPRDSVIARGKDWSESMAALLDLSVKVKVLRDESRDSWSLKAMRTVLTLARKESNYLEKPDLQKAVDNLLADLPQPRKPSRSTEEVKERCLVSAQGASLSKQAVDRLGKEKAASRKAGNGDEDGLKALSMKAKSKGNEAYQSGDFQKATYHYSMAIRLDPGNHVNYSNRSASHACQGNWQSALEDGERCIKISPNWGKGFARKAAALLGLGQAGEALKTYKAGLKADPGNEACKGGIAEAKESIRMHQQRYEEMWGK